MRNTILGFVLGVIFCLCLASTTDFMVVRPAKPSGMVVERFGDPTSAKTYADEMFLKGWQIQELNTGNYGIFIVMVKY